MTLRWAVLIMATLSLAFADTLTLNNGTVVHGTYLGGDARHVRMAVEDQIRSFDVSDISILQFGGTSTQSAASTTGTQPATGTQAATTQSSGTEMTQPMAAAPSTTSDTSGVEIPAGSEVVIRMIDSVDSEVNRVGQTFRASVDEPVMVDGRTVVPRGADVVVKLAQAEQSGKFTGTTELTLALVSLDVNGKTVDAVSQDVTTESGSRGKKTAKVVGGTAALGAIIGAIAGGGKGAAIGATTGAGAGAAVQVLTKGQTVKIPSETRLTFTLKQPVRL